MNDSELPALFLACRSLASLGLTDPRLVYLTKEINLYLEVLRSQGQREYLSPYDLKTLFARMTDLATISPNLRHEEKAKTPIQAPGSLEPDLKLDLDEIANAAKRSAVIPPKFLTSVKKEPSS